jgi:hypothetical protein
MLNVVILNGVMLSVILLNVVTLSVVAPKGLLGKNALAYLFGTKKKSFLTFIFISVNEHSNWNCAENNNFRLSACDEEPSSNMITVLILNRSNFVKFL